LQQTFICLEADFRAQNCLPAMNLIQSTKLQVWTTVPEAKQLCLLHNSPKIVHKKNNETLLLRGINFALSKEVIPKMLYQMY
jgi:hypothetical protein